MCIQMRSGVEIWVEAAKAEPFQKDLEATTQHFFARFAGQTVNTADVVGVFAAATMDEYTRRKNGQWKCDKGNWHDRGVKCDCIPSEEKKLIEARARAIRECKRGCNNGFVVVKNEQYPNGANTYCECVRNLHT